AVIREVKSQSLGEAIDGAQGTIGPPAQFVQRLVSLTIEALRRKVVTQKWMQILAGRWVRCLLFRREAMTCFTELWRFLVRIKGQASLPAKVREELIAALTLLPLLRCDLRVPISGLVTVSDASVQRGAVCRSVLLRRDEVAAARAASRRLVTDFRDEAKRVTKYAWPEVLEVGDAQSFGHAEAMAIRDRVPHTKWILLIGGSPCTDLARINVERVGLQGRRSKLFFEIARVRLLLEEMLGEFFRLVTLIENVASVGAEPRNVMSERLGHRPVRVEAGCIARCYRDRLCWIDENLLCEWQGDVSVSDGVKMIHVPGGPGPVRRWMRDLGGGATIEDASVTLDDVNLDEGVPIRQHNLEDPDAALDPVIVIVEELARRAEARGSDVRLGTFEAMRPDLWPRRPISVARWTWRATAIWEWKRPSHITDLEVCAAARCQCVDLAACERQQIRAHVDTFELLRGLIWTGASDHVDKLDLLVAERIEWLWTEGHLQGLVGNALSAVQFFLRKKRILPASWRLLRAWQNLELPQRALPLPEVVLLAMAATARGWGRNDIAVLLVLGFAGFLRTTEMLTLRQWQIAIDEARAKIVIILPITKSGLRFHRQESVVIDDPSVVQLASFLLRHLSPDALILNSSISEFRDKFEPLCT
ncbi:unnamed protein product, partial [Prorocentrum cordatum]